MLCDAASLRGTIQLELVFNFVSHCTGSCYMSF